MVHGPCGEWNPNSPCTVDGKCSKGYPKPIEDVTTWTETSAYPKYRRRNLRTATVGKYLIDKRWIVPYNPYLSLKFPAHINVEACVSPFAAKYLFLLHKKGMLFHMDFHLSETLLVTFQGTDRAVVRLDG